MFGVAFETDDVAETTVSESSFDISKWYRDLQCNWFIGTNDETSNEITENHDSQIGAGAGDIKWEFIESVEVACEDSTVLNEEGDCD